MGATIKDWFSAFRLRTLPLAFSSIITGSAIAYYHFSFNATVFVLALLTTLFLQVLSNLANDYGDSKQGTDNKHRVGPTRAIQSGAISLGSMKKAIVICSVLCFATGIPLIIEGTKNISITWLLAFLGLGITSVVAAVKYTAGKNPYGYKGLGDVFVFVFFGIVGVLGTFLLQFQIVNRLILQEAILPAIAMGCFSAAVLHLNNMRDCVNDRNSNKITLAIRLGKTGSKVYHALLILVGIACLYVFGNLIYFSVYDYLWLSIPFLLLIKHLFFVLKNNDPKALDPELKKVALMTFATSLILLMLIIRSY